MSEQKSTGPLPGNFFAPLEGLSVLDFSHALAGPYCTLVLGQYGAAIYKLEPSDGGDMGRTWGPPYYGDQASYFMGLNNGKQGISVDLKQPEGIELCLKLVERVDVLLENFRPGTMERLGLGYAAAQSRNPKLIYCSISGYGQTGPSRDEGAMDLIVQASSGLMSVTGSEGGETIRCGYSVADVSAGMFAIMGILMALRSRERTGHGQYIDVSMLDGMISAMTSCYMIYLGSNENPIKQGSGYQTVSPYRVLPASDREFAFAVGSEKLWTAFCKAIDRSDLEHHPDYTTNSTRMHNRQALDSLLADVFRTRTAAEWLAILRKAGVPCSLVKTLHEVANDPQSQHRGMFPVIDDPEVGPHRVTGPPIKFSDMQSAPGDSTASKSAPRIGQDTRAALHDLLGLDDSALRDLEHRRVIFSGDQYSQII